MTKTCTDNRCRKRVVIIGAGASGLMAAGTLFNCDVTVIERNEKPGKKLYITGKGRCNVTNDCNVEEFLSNVVGNAKFLYSCLHGFTPTDTRELLQAYGVPTKVERGNRVFPCSDKASDVIRALYLRAQENGAKFRFNERVRDVKRRENAFFVRTDVGEYICDALLIATGGISYPSTGSTGDGYDIAAQWGHIIVAPRPSLVALRLKQDVSALTGLTLKNVSVRIETSQKKFTQFGELLFTHQGVSGPAILKLSALINRIQAPMRLYIDLKPALSETVLDERLMRDFAQNCNKQLKNALDDLLPKAMVRPVLEQSGVSFEKKINILTKEERQKLLYSCKNLCYDIVSLDAMENAVVTAGGISVKNIYPKTMESKLVSNLYFAGEIIDVDAFTGGFNIQIALSTAYAAAKAINGE